MVSVTLVVIMCLTMAPLQGLVGLDIGSWFASEANAALLTEDEYIEQHVNFVNSNEYSDLIETAGFYDSIWQYEETTKLFTAFATWNLAGDVKDFITLNWCDLLVVKNPYDIILADIFANYGLNDSVINACEGYLKGVFNVVDAYENILKVLKTSPQWDASMEKKIKQPLNDYLSYNKTKLIDGILVSTEDYKFKDKEPEAYNILKNIFPTVSDNSWNYVFKSLDQVSTIKNYIDTGADIVTNIFDAYQKYLIAETLVTVEQDVLGALLLASSYMSFIPQTLLETSIDEYIKVLDSDSAFSMVCDYALEGSIKNVYDLFKGSLSKIVYNGLANVLGVSAGSINSFVFYYSITYSFLDYFSGLGDMSPLFFLIEAASSLESCLSIVVEDLANDLIKTPTLKYAELFDASWGLLQSLESYLYSGLAKYISGMKKSYEFTFNYENIALSTLQPYSLLYTIYSLNKLNNKLTVADGGIEAALNLESAWKNASCHTGVFENSKVVSIKCPTDVYVYNRTDELVLSIVSNNIEYIASGIAAIVDGAGKIFVLPSSQNYNINIVGTDEGTMDYKVTEIAENAIMRTIEYESVPLTAGCEYNASMPKEIYTDAKNYNLIADTGEEIKADYDSLPPTEDNVVDVIVAEELFDGFPVEIIDLVADTMFNMESVVDLSSYDISTDDAVALFSAVAKYYPAEYSLIANSDFTYKIIVSPNLDRIMKIRFYYGDDANLSTYQKRVNDLNAEIDALVAQVEGMEDFEKALYVHDYIVLNCEYDLELLEYLEINGTLTGEMRSEKYTEYSVLINGTGICGSYALAYRAILNAAGMECLYLSSQQMDHAWNMVKIDGKWYHVDCCWDDPVPDTYGMAKRTYFLRTDKEIMELNHYSWTPGQYKATSDKYCNMPRNYDIKQKYDDGKWYYLEGSTLYSSDEYGNNETEITSISASSIDVDDGDIYYSNGRCIYNYDLEKLNSLLMYQIPKVKSGSKIDKAYIKNMYVDDSVVEYYKSIYDNEGESKTIYEAGVLDADNYSTITNIELDKTELTLDVFETDKLNATIVTNNGIESDVELTWFSSDDMVATVDDFGNITAKNTGSTTISVQLGHILTTCQLTVTGDGLKGSCGNNVKWLYDKYKSTLTIYGTGEMTDFTTDSTIYSANCTPWYKFNDEIERVNIDLGVTTIGRSSFGRCKALKSITIPDSVKRIGEYTFYECEKITDIIIPNSVVFIGNGSFWYCSSLASVVLPENIDSIKSSLFSNCYSLKSVNIPEAVETIENSAFFNCSSLVEIYIPQKVESIETSAFGGDCSSLLSITVSDNNANYCSDKFGVLYNKNKTDLIRYPIGNTIEEFSIPNSVKTIKTGALKNSVWLRNINIPTGVSAIESQAFQLCTSLESIVLPSGLTDILSETFYGCENLCSVTLPSSISTIKNGAFENCLALSKLTIPEKVAEIGYRAFSNTDICSLSIPNSVETIESNSFAYCDNLEYVYIGSGISNLSSSAFYGCNKLSKINISSYNKTYCAIDGVLFSKDKTEIVIYPSGKMDSNYKIPDGVVKIYSDTFNTCNNLKTLAISKDVEVLGKENGSLYFVGIALDPDVFTMCDGLVEFIVDAENPYFTSEDGILYNKDKTMLLKYPNNKTNIVYKVSDFVENISPAAFSGTQNLISLIIPDNVKEMSNNSTVFIWFNTENASLEYLFLEGDTNLYFNHINKSHSLKKIYVTNGKKPIFSTNTNNKNITFYAPSGTITETYALENGNPFVDINAEPHVHDYFLMGYLEPTEIEDGYELWECYCRQDRYKVVLHYFGKEVTTNPSCVVDGNKSKTCLNCGEVEVIETVPAIGKHDYKLISTIPGTCTTAPVNTYECSVCGDAYTKNGKIDDGHSYVETVVKPTCDKKGYTTATCSECGETVIYDYTSPKGHEFIINRPEGYCSAHNTLEYSCKNCDYSECIAADTANLVTEIVTVEPTCTNSGTKSEICTLCGATVSEEILNPLSHKYADEFTVDVEATCTDEGSKSQHCTRCDAKRAVTAIESTGHQNTSIINVVNATCTKNGYTGDTFCSDCNSVIASGINTDMIKHEYSSVVTAPTCTTGGFTTYTCSCGDTYTSDETAMLGHNMGSYNVVEQASCTVSGLEIATCSRCDHNETRSIPAKGHNYVDGECTSCGGSKTDNCSHMCHKTGFMGFIWKLINIFNKLFKSNKTCACGVAHY